MRNLKRVWTLFLSLVVVLSLCIPAYAAAEDTGFSDVEADAWYAEFVVYCRDNGLMAGTSDTTFSPDTPTTRAMMATILYRLAGTPAVSGTDSYTDTQPGAWYSDAVLWASQNGVVSGYGNGLFGTNDSLTREQMATMLWRYSGSPSANAGSDFADESSISAWAGTAVDWAGVNGYMGGVGAGLFRPQGQATRAQMATILTRYHQDAETPVTSEPEPESEPEDGETLVAYFSATGNTESIAQHIQTILGTDLYEIVPEDPYTSEDLNYSNDDCRANQEQNDPSARPAIDGSVEHMEDYDVVFLGYPIWWGQAPKIIHTFLESYDLDGVTIVPFCTSGSSGIGSSATNLQSLAPNANWLSAQRFSGSASQDTVASWVEGLDLPKASADTEDTQTQLRLTFEGGEVVVVLEDNATTRDFLTMLPTTLTFEDYAGSEKISYLTQDLSTADAPATYDPQVGDVTLYGPWGNLAIFYGDAGSSSGLVPMGHVKSGLELLSTLDGEFEVSVAVMEKLPRNAAVGISGRGGSYNLL